MTRTKRADGLTVPEYHATVSEREFELAVTKAAVLLGWEVFHVYDARRFWRGWPDWIGFHPGGDGRPGRHLWFELKRTGEPLRKDQERWHQRIREGGGEVYTWRPEDWDALVRVLGGEP